MQGISTKPFVCVSDECSRICFNLDSFLLFLFQLEALVSLHSYYAFNVLFKFSSAGAAAAVAAAADTAAAAAVAAAVVAAAAAAILARSDMLVDMLYAYVYVNFIGVLCTAELSSFPFVYFVCFTYYFFVFVLLFIAGPAEFEWIFA